MYKTQIPILLIGGFPHSDISGLSLTYSSPDRFVVSYVLLRLLVPRHPLCALSSLTLLFSFVLIYLLFKDLLKDFKSLKTKQLTSTNF